MTSFLALAPWTAGGLVFGLAYFASLRRNVELFCAGGGRLVAAALSLVRWAAAILFLGVSARFGALALLAGFLGFLVARTLALFLVRRTA